MFLPLLTCVMNDEITSCTETTGKTLSDQKHFIIWRVWMRVNLSNYCIEIVRKLSTNLKFEEQQYKAVY